MVHSLVGLQMSVRHDSVDLISLNPQNVPVVTFDFFVAFFAQGIEDAVAKGGLELDL